MVRVRELLLSTFFTSMALGGCATPRASQGLLEGEGLIASAAEGDLGIDRMQFRGLQFRAPSGLKLAFEQTPTRGMVAVVLTVAAGSTSDPAGKEGLAHWVEHLTFRSRQGPVPVSERLARLGATYNAETGLDHTRFFEFAPAEALPELLALAARRLAAPLDNLDPKDVGIELDVVRAELRQRNETNVYGQALGWIHAALFPAGHPYARPPAGTEQSLGNLTLQDARTFVAAHYKPENTTLLIVGEMDGGKAHAIARGLPQPLLGKDTAPVEPTRPQVRPLPREPPPAPPGGAYRHRAAISRPEVLVTWLLPSAYSQAGAMVKLVTAPVLERTLREILLKDPDVVSVEVIPLRARQATVLACQIGLRDDKRRPEIAKQIGEVVAAVWRLPSRAEAEVAASKLGIGSGKVHFNVAMFLFGLRQRALAQAAFGAEPYAARALERSEYLSVLGDASLYTRSIEEIATTDLRPLSEFASKYLAETRARVIYVDPIPPEDRPAPSVVGVGSTREIDDKPFAATEVGPPPKPVAPLSEGNRHFHLANGLEVAMVRRPQYPVVTVALAFNGGPAMGNPPGVVDLLRHVQRPEGWSLPLNGVELDRYDSIDFTADVVRAGKGNLSNALALLAVRVVVGDNLPWEEITDEIDKDEKEQAPPATAGTPHARAGRELMAALYPGHPYGRAVSASDIGALTADQIRDWFLRMHNPRNATLVMVGDFELAAAEDLARRMFGAWQATLTSLELKPPESGLPPPGPPREQVLVYDRPGGSQTEIAIACRLPGGSPRALAVDQTLQNVVGSYLLTRLRAEAGVAYGVDGSVRVFRGGAAHMVLSAAVDNHRLADVLRVIRGHLSRFADGGFDSGALSQTRWNLARSEALRYQTSTEVALRLVDALNHGWALDFVDRHAEELAAVTREELAAAFAVCRRSTVLSIIGDQRMVNAALRK